MNLLGNAQSKEKVPVSVRLFGKRYIELTSEQKRFVMRDSCKRYNNLHKKERCASQGVWRKKNRSKVSGYHKAWRERLWKTFMDHYGHCCSCCGEPERNFLSIEHLDGGGKKHRQRKRGSTGRIIIDIIKQGLPDTYTVLCMNCNQGKYRNGGVCPHVVKKAHGWLEEIRVIQKEINESPR